MLSKTAVPLLRSAASCWTGAASAARHPARQHAPVSRQGTFPLLWCCSHLSSSTSLSIHCGIVGLPNVGKSTLFNALVGDTQARAENFPFCTIDPNSAVVDVPDAALEALGAMNDSQRVVPTQLTFVDIAGLVKGASKGAGLGNKFLANIRDCDLIVHVIRGFVDDDVTHVEGTMDIVRDASIINLELILSDMAQVERRLERIKKQRTPDAEKERGLLQRVHALLNSEQPARNVEVSASEARLLQQLQLLTTKPMIYAVNVSEDAYSEAADVVAALERSPIGSAAEGDPILSRSTDGDNSFAKAVQALSELQGRSFVTVVSAELESQLHSLSQEDQELFIEELGLASSATEDGHGLGLSRVIRAAYHNLDLITFYTSGPTETRAWTVRKGSTAKEAAGKIHSDIAQRFIKAETINFSEFREHKGMEAARRAGLVRSEGKDYVVQEGDIILFKHNA